MLGRTGFSTYPPPRASAWRVRERAERKANTTALKRQGTLGTNNLYRINFAMLDAARSAACQKNGGKPAVAANADLPMIRHERGRSFYPIPDELSTPFHGGNRGSSPLGSANHFKYLRLITLFSTHFWGVFGE